MEFILYINKNTLVINAALLTVVYSETCVLNNLTVFPSEGEFAATLEHNFNDLTVLAPHYGIT
jgi:hypothetical protein